MTSVPHSHLPYGETGSGHYGDWLARQDAANIDVVRGQIFAALDSIPVRNGPGQVFTIGDYGTADGSVTIPLIGQLIAAVRKRHGQVPVQVVYEDQPSNDFNSVFKRVHGLIPDPPTYLNEHKDVFVLASGASFYCQILPDAHADLIMSFIAAHWMSDPPTKFENSFHRFPDANAAERKLVAAQASKDWEAFLLLRAKELKPGGVLIVSTPSEDPGMKQKGIRSCNQGTEEGMLTMWRKMRDEGKITQEEFKNTNMHRCLRFLEEYRAPFDDPNSPVSKAGLRLVSAQQVLSPCLAQQGWQHKLEKEGVDARQGWAEAVVQQHRCWSNSSFLSGLAESRPLEERLALVDEMYARLTAHVAAQDPKVFSNYYLLGYVFARKV